MKWVKYFIKNVFICTFSVKIRCTSFKNIFSTQKSPFESLHSKIWPIFDILILKEVVGEGHTEHFPFFCNKRPVLAHNWRISCYFFLGSSTTSLFINNWRHSFCEFHNTRTIVSFNKFLLVSNDILMPTIFCYILLSFKIDKMAATQNWIKGEM